MTDIPRHIGVLLAAGRGGRMGGLKQAKPWPTLAGPKPLICAAYDAIRPICDDMIVVLGYEADTVAAILADRPFQRVVCEPGRPMFDSIRAGLLAAQSLDIGATVVLHPADHPEVRLATLQMLATHSPKHPSQAIIPEFESRGGHPILIPPSVVTSILADDCPEGLGQFWRDHPVLCMRISVDDATVLRDIDTPADLPQQ